MTVVLCDWQTMCHSTEARRFSFSSECILSTALSAYTSCLSCTIDVLIFNIMVWDSQILCTQNVFLESDLTAIIIAMDTELSLL